MIDVHTLRTVVSQEGEDGSKDTVVSLVPPQLQGYRAVVQDMQEALDLDTQGACMMMRGSFATSTCRFWLWGSMSVVALRANLNIFSGRDSTTVDQVEESLPSKALTVCPWITRPVVWLSLEAVLAAWTRAL